MFSKNLPEIIEKIDKLLNLNKIIFVSIEGNSGSGKSTLANALNEIYNCNLFHMDDFFLTPELRTNNRLREVGGNVDYLRFNKEVIQGVLSEKDFYYKRYNCMNDSLVKSKEIKTKKLNIVEGCYSMHPTLINNYDLKIFLEISSDIQTKRILERNGTEKLQRFLNEWIPKENQYYKEMKIKEKADIIISF